ncbi:hypothetical protein EZ449_14235 [Pedobacter frigidisoli]|uniref:Uncharacterized protein n=1 Tax=Pedobacter frigidisoli TaxID=2530455 RepID=A0A4R0NZ10_9SPHI|nr:hypothetical protein [Pedobacter frigidisoli]TCD07690.1 hypothetical protein EZ449_14235 [Pedobacter frigidisoli]
MKILLFYLLFLLAGQRAVGQIYVDPATSAAVAAHAGVINSQLNATTDKLTLIQRAQLAITGELVVVNSLQQDIYRGLSEVSSVMRSLLSVQDIYSISEDIVSDLNKSLAISRDNPALLLFAESGAREFKARATRLAAEVSSFVLLGGKNNLMDSGERAKLLNRIVNELSIIRGVSYGIYRAMFWARQRGIWNLLNPYASFINTDRRIADQILSQTKTLRP